MIDSRDALIADLQSRIAAQDARIAALEAAQDDVRRVLRHYTYGTAAWRPTGEQSGTAVDIAYHLGIDLREGD